MKAKQYRMLAAALAAATTIAGTSIPVFADDTKAPTQTEESSEKTLVMHGLSQR